jgi:hypothetical protein
VNSLEDRLRDAYRAATDTVDPETIRSPPDLGAGRVWSRGGSARQNGRRSRPSAMAWSRGRSIGVPLAAAVAVAAIVVTASMVAPRMPARPQGHGPGPVGSLAQGYPGHRLPGGAAPKFYVALQVARSQENEAYATTLNVYDTATGQRVGRLPSPVRNRFFQTVAALGNDRTFVVAASYGQRSSNGPRTCGTWLYQFRLTAQGKPTGLTQLMPEIAGFAQSNALAASADGTTVAYDTAQCTETSVPRDDGQVGLLNVSTHQAKTWTYKSPATPESLSLSADGSLLSLVSNPSNGTPDSSDSFNLAWALRTASPPGQLGQRYRKLSGPPEGVAAAVLSPTGSVLISAVPHLYPRSAHWRWRLTLDTYQLTTGRLIREQRVFPRLDSIGPIGFSSDTSGRYVLVSGWTYRLEVLDLSTGQNRFLPHSASHFTEGAAW